MSIIALNHALNEALTHCILGKVEREEDPQERAKTDF